MAELNIAKLFDTKSLLQIGPYTGKRSDFQDWKWTFLIAMRAISPTVHAHLQEVEDKAGQDFNLSRLTDEQRKIAEQVYTMLALLLKEDANEYVRTAEDGNGFQAWQNLLRSNQPRNNIAMLNRLLDPQFTSRDPRANLRQWNKDVAEYEKRCGEKGSEGIRKNVYLTKIAPAEMRQHLLLHGSCAGAARRSPNWLQQELHFAPCSGQLTGAHIQQ